MNVWRRGSLTTNPYVRTAFRVARVPRETTRHKTIVQLVGQTRRIVRVDPQAHAILGEPVTDAEINAAEQVLLDPKRRIMEELLHHAAEKPPLDRVRKQAAQAAEAMASEDSEDLPITNLSALESWARRIVTDLVEASPPTDPSFGALELELLPPYGRRREG